MLFLSSLTRRIALATGLLLLFGLSGVSQANLKCEEMTAARYCADSAPRPWSAATGTIYIAAPVIPGYATACWNWHKRFQCVETNPVYSCASGRDFNDVKNSCSLTQASIKATVKVNAVTYITDASYTYRCSFGDWATTDELPKDKQCVLLDSQITDTHVDPSAPIGSAPSTGSGNPPTTPPLTDSTTTDQDRVQQYVCYSEPTTVCSDTCYENYVNPATGIQERREVACTSPVTNCVSTSNQCDSALQGAENDGTIEGAAEAGVGGSLVLGPDGRCVSSHEQFVCQNGPIPKCLNNEQCTLDSARPSEVQNNGVALTEEQTYICSNQTKSCGEIATANNCVTVDAWGWDKLQHKSTAGVGLGEANAALSKLDAIQKGMNKDDPYIFSGQNLRCHYPVGNFLNTAIMVALVVVTMIATSGTSSGLLSTALQSQSLWGTAALSAGTANAIGAAVSIGGGLVGDIPNSAAFGTNCCKDYVIEGSEAWYKFGACSADEVKLAVARQKGLYYYLGSYCSKKSGFPIRQCVEKTKSYCVFDDMLALVVNKQGRDQLTQLAAADPATARTTPEMRFNLFAAAPQIQDPEQQTPPPAQDWDNTSGSTSGLDITRPAIYSGVLDNGAWKQLINQNGSQVWYWQYPTYCASPEAQQKAYDTFNAEVQWAADMSGVQPGKMTPAEAMIKLKQIADLHPFQDCAESPGELTFMTCDDAGNACDATGLPDGPSEVYSDMYGEQITDADLRWRLQQVRSDYLLGQYGITLAMQTDPSFAAVSESLSQLVSSVGSCKDGSCLYRFVVTDRAASQGLGASKRVTEYARFPLYTPVQSPSYPAVDYVTPDGVLDQAAYAADPNKHLGNVIAVNKQSFIFRPYLQKIAPKDGNLHSKVLLEWASSVTGTGNWRPIMVPSNLPPATDGFAPYVAYPGAGKADRFYISGGCDRNSRWCDYQMQVELNVPQHPWGSPKAPRCWGFTIEQMAALDFDRMDLSEWINSLDLGATDATGMSENAAKAMTEQITKTANAFYGAYVSGESTQSLVPGEKSLVTNTDKLPNIGNSNYDAYVLKLGLTSNWPIYNAEGVNDNPVSNVSINWGDGATSGATLSDTGAAWLQGHDYGGMKNGRFTVKVDFDTKLNGHQTLTTSVEITPDAGGKRADGGDLQFGNQGTSGTLPGEVVPSNSIDGTNTAPENIEQIAPGQKELFDAQGSTVTPPG